MDQYVNFGETYYTAKHPLIQYSGRIGEDEKGSPELIFSCSYMKFHFKGTGAAIIIKSKKYYWNVYAGLIIDGIQSCVRLLDDGTQRIEIGHGMVDTDHIVTLFKRQDGCNVFTLEGIVLDKGGELRECPDKPARRIEVYGDSVSAGEVSEAIMCIAQPDPEGHEGCYSNSWHSYSWITARKLKAEIHNISHGGLPLLPGSGWLGCPEGLIGLEQIYDKVRYYPDIKNATKWDFKKYTPHVVIVAIGQNDSSPEDYMKDDYNGHKADYWRKRYRDLILKLRELYPLALIICTTTILCHDPSWDRAIDEVVDSIDDKKITHFMYKLNGIGTPGHIRIPEAEMMAQELSGYIDSFGSEIWI